MAETEEPGARVMEVAARHGVYPGLLFTWRRQVRDGVLTPPPPAVFTPVRMLEPMPEAKTDTSSALAGMMLRQAFARKVGVKVRCKVDVRRTS